MSQKEARRKLTKASSCKDGCEKKNLKPRKSTKRTRTSTNRRRRRRRRRRANARTSTNRSTSESTRSEVASAIAKRKIAVAAVEVVEVVEAVEAVGAVEAVEVVEATVVVALPVAAARAIIKLLAWPVPLLNFSSRELAT